MTLTTEQRLDAISRYSREFATAARGNLSARVEHCPDWSVADLVRHLTDVHWFWGTIAEGTLSEPPDESLRPAHADDEGLVAGFESGAVRLVDVLAGADQSASCWTWFPGQQDVAFITRHQVQEAAVHAWDAANAAGRALDIDPAVAADSVDEFLTTSLADESDAAEADLVPLDGTFVLRASDTGDAWTVADGSVPGAMMMTRGGTEGAPVLEAQAADLLLWLYSRTELAGDVPADLLARFRGLSSTD
jgi:uncharacterized protein (TIGR03083 family)